MPHGVRLGGILPQSATTRRECLPPGLKRLFALVERPLTSCFPGRGSGFGPEPFPSTNMIVDLFSYRRIGVFCFFWIFFGGSGVSPAGRNRSARHWIPANFPFIRPVGLRRRRNDRVGDTPGTTIWLTRSPCGERYCPYFQAIPSDLPILRLFRFFFA